MPGFKQGDVVKVPFPYTDRATRQFRPAAVVSEPGLERRHGLLWVVMITSAANRGWSGDVAIANLERAGLPVASLARTEKIATIDAADATCIGSLGRAQTTDVLGKVLGMLGYNAGF